jgi:hypothetical protein
MAEEICRKAGLRLQRGAPTQHNWLSTCGASSVGWQFRPISRLTKPDFSSASGPTFGHAHDHT